jgi:hypothetical protein
MDSVCACAGVGFLAKQLGIKTDDETNAKIAGGARDAYEFVSSPFLPNFFFFFFFFHSFAFP